MTGWGDMSIDEEGDDMDEQPVSDGDVLGDVLKSRSRKGSRASTIPHEQRWEADFDAFKPEQVGSLVRCHDLILCADVSLAKLFSAVCSAAWGLDQRYSALQLQPDRYASVSNPVPDLHIAHTVLSASSDGSIKAWNPHSAIPSEPSVIGTHNDYVRCLSYW